MQTLLGIANQDGRTASMLGDRLNQVLAPMFGAPQAQPPGPAMGAPPAQPAGMGGPAPSRRADPNQIIAGLIERGMAPHIAQGVAANMMAESRLDTGINEIAPLVPESRGGFGLNQWTGPRRTALEAAAEARGVPVDDLGFQLDYTMEELGGAESRAMQALQGATTAEEAARIYSEQFLRPGIPHMDRRLAYARQFAGAAEDPDSIYRDIGSALGVTVSTSGELGTSERRNVEAELGSILNEVYDPESSVDARQRERVADLFTGLGVGFGQMSRGDRVDLSEVRAAAERRHNQNVQLRLERARRAAGASYAMEMGDEGMARAIAGGAADIGNLLTARQMRLVDERTLRAEARELASNDAIVAALQEAGIPLGDAAIEAIRLSGPDALSTVVAAQDRVRATEALAEEAQRTEEISAANMALAQQLVDAAARGSEPHFGIIGNQMLAAGGTLSFADAQSQLGELGRPRGVGASPPAPVQEYQFYAAQEQAAGRQPLSFAEWQSAPSAAATANLAAAQTVLRNPDAAQAQIDAANLVVETGGELSMLDAASQLGAGAPPADNARAERIRTASEGLLEAGVPADQVEPLARGIADGRFIGVRSEQTGEFQLLDQFAMLSGNADDAVVYPPRIEPGTYDPPPIVSGDVDYSAAFGPQGVVLNALNNVGEALGFGLLSPENREAVTVIRRLATAGRIASAVEIGGRPSVTLLNMFEALETNPAELFTGAETALIRLGNQRDALARELRTLDELRAPQSRMPASVRAEATERHIRMLPVLHDLDVIIGGILRAQVGEAEAPAGAQAQTGTPIEPTAGPLPSGVYVFNPLTGELEPEQPQ
jgi:hypothetical protein